MSENKPDPLASFLGFAVEVDPSLPADVVQFRGETGKVLATLVNVAPPARPIPAEVAVRRPDPPENTASMLADARLRGLIRTIIEERGMAMAVSMVQRAMLEAAHDARTSGHSMQGFIG